MSEVSASYARHPQVADVPHREARRIAEAVRAPWREGGPKMRRTTELHVPVPNGSVRVRIYDPDAGALKSALVYLHGGGWTLFSIDTHDRLMREYAHRGSIAVVGVDYPLAPETKFPVALEQLVEVIHWLEAEGAGFGVDARRLAIGGDSAGGNLALATALKLRDSGSPESLRALLLNYGGFDVHCSDDSARRFGGPGYMLTREELTMFWNNYLRGPEDFMNPLACPIHARLEGLPPVFLTIPQCDVLTEQSHAMADRLKRAGVSVTAKVYPGATHSFLEAVSVAAVAGRALDDGARWMKSQLQ